MKRKATALAHPMQALVKYHGLRDWDLRIPYHDSISVNLDSLWTKVGVEFGNFEQDSVRVDGRRATGREFARCMSVIARVRELSGSQDKSRVVFQSSLKPGSAKGLGFSSSAGAAIAAAAFEASGLRRKFGWDLRLISRIARRLAGSACRSAVGGYARWYAGRDDESSYAEKIGTRRDLDMAMIVIPLSSELETEQAHRDATSSPFFRARIRSATRRTEQMQKAIKRGDLSAVGQLTEADTLELHAITMTGSKGLIVYKPESIAVMNKVKRLREAGTEVYFSMQTGPSVFINTRRDLQSTVREAIEGLGVQTLTARVGGEVRIVA